MHTSQTVRPASCCIFTLITCIFSLKIAPLGPSCCEASSLPHCISCLQSFWSKFKAKRVFSVTCFQVSAFAPTQNSATNLEPLILSIFSGKACRMFSSECFCTRPNPYDQGGSDLHLAIFRTYMSCRMLSSECFCTHPNPCGQETGGLKHFLKQSRLVAYFQVSAFPPNSNCATRFMR